MVFKGTSLSDLVARGLVSDEADEAVYLLNHDPRAIPVMVDMAPVSDLTSSWFREAFMRHFQDNGVLLYHSPNCGQIIIEHVEEFEDWGPANPQFNGLERLRQISAMLDRTEPKNYVVEPAPTLPFYQQAAQRPWSTPNRKRFKRANRRRK